MALPFVTTLISAVSGLFFRRGDSEKPGTGKQMRPLPTALCVLLAFLALYYFLVWPILNFHFPEYGFPPLDVTALGAAFAALGSM